MATNKCKPLPPLSKNDIARFWSKADVRGPDECWPWKGTLDSYGYGSFSVRDKALKASRIAYFLHHGKDPFPYGALHSCDNPPCCNGAHVFTGTDSDNMADKVSKGRQSRGFLHVASLHPAKGEMIGVSKLTTEKVICIRKCHAEGYSLADLGEMFVVTRQSIWAVVHRKTWKHI